MRLMVDCVAFLLAPLHHSGKELQSHRRGEVIFARVAVDQVRIELLSGLNLLLENLDVGLHELVLVAFSRIAWSCKSGIGSSEGQACSRSHWTIGEDHDNDLQVALGNQGFELVFSVMQYGLQRQFYAVITQFGQSWQGCIKTSVRRLQKKMIILK